MNVSPQEKKKAYLFSAKHHEMFEAECSILDNLMHTTLDKKETCVVPVRPLFAQHNNY